MATISPLSFLSPLNIVPSTSSEHSKPKRHHDPKVACNANQSDPITNLEDGKPSHILGNRRDVLIGLGGLCGAATLSNNNPLAMAAPVSPPDLTTCGPPDLPQGAKPTNCCPSSSTTIIDFKIPTPNQPLRVRPAAHLVNDDYIANYKEAIRLMKALPPNDPRSFTQQANIHCAYCDGAYEQVGFPDLDLQVHNSWLFFPFHRWYLYFYERILGSLIGDPNFALPFWNWDSPPGMPIPAIYTDPKSPLHDPLRNANHQPPTLLDLNYNRQDTIAVDKERISTNLTVLYRQVVSVGNSQGSSLEVLTVPEMSLTLVLGP